MRWLVLPAVAWVLFGCQGGLRPAATPALDDLVRGYDRETLPYNPFTASEMGLSEYDRVLANDIGEEYRRGLREICARYRDGLRRLDPARLGERERVTYDVHAFRTETCVT